MPRKPNLAAIEVAMGKFAHIPVSSEEFTRRRSEEKKREERQITER